MREDFDLTRHFTFYELTGTDAHELQDENRANALAYTDNLVRLAKTLEAARLVLGALRITSGYRCQSVNALVGGAPTSAHMDGRAADCVAVSGDTPEQMARKLLEAGFTFHQMLIEPECLHIGIAPKGADNAREVAYWKNGRKQIFTA